MDLKQLPTRREMLADGRRLLKAGWPPPHLGLPNPEELARLEEPDLGDSIDDGNSNDNSPDPSRIAPVGMGPRRTSAGPVESPGRERLGDELPGNRKVMLAKYLTRPRNAAVLAKRLDGVTGPYV